ncbi:DJ-1/PfpI family protein [Sinomonas sp. B1-1]|uniref:DJ-1/PfpI family protein n=1 Tax=Sinomonas sp. B1-1 TaxID=3141454 RepID=UPI003D2754A1
MRAILKTIAKVLVVVVAALALPAAAGAAAVNDLVSTLNAPRTDGATARPAPAAYDPAKPTAVVVVGDKGAVVSDALAPYEILASTGAFNVYTVAPEAHPVPLTGGLDLVPDFTFAQLERLIGKASDVVVVPAMPDVADPSADPVAGWLARQASAGSLVLTVCNGGAIAASAGVLDGHRATAHWLRLDEWARTYPRVDWVRGTRYVDDGAVVSTAGILSGVDGTLRVVERLVGAKAAADAAAAIGWPHYHPGGPAPMEQARLEPRDAVAAVNTAFRWDRQKVGVLLEDGVGEIELASVFDTFGQSLAVRTVAVGAGPVHTRHGLTFVPRAATAAGLDRVIVPGSGSGGAVAGAAAEYPHRDGGFPYDGVLRNLARTTDVATARWTAKVLEYPVDDLGLAGQPWPWDETLRPVALALVGVLAALGAFALVRARRRPTAGPAVREREPEGAGTR